MGNVRTALASALLGLRDQAAQWVPAQITATVTVNVLTSDVGAWEAGLGMIATCGPAG